MNQLPQLIYPIPRRGDRVIYCTLYRRLRLQAEPVAVLRAGQRGLDGLPLLECLVDGRTRFWLGSPHIHQKVSYEFHVVVFLPRWLVQIGQGWAVDIAARLRRTGEMVHRRGNRTDLVKLLEE